MSSLDQMGLVHKFVPAENPNSTTTVVLFHGTGGDEEDLLPIGKALAPGAALLGVRGNVMEGTAPRFFRRLSEGVFDEVDLIFRTHELARFLEVAAEAYSFDLKHVVAVGYSNGANIAASLMLLEPAILSAAVLFRAMVPLEPETLPVLTGRRVLLQSGRHDAIVPVSSVERLAELFSQSGAQVTVQWHNAGHGLISPEIQIAQTWMAALTR